MLNILEILKSFEILNIYLDQLLRLLDKTKLRQKLLMFFISLNYSWFYNVPEHRLWTR